MRVNNLLEDIAAPLERTSEHGSFTADFSPATPLEKLSLATHEVEMLLRVRRGNPILKPA